MISQAEILKIQLQTIIIKNCLINTGGLQFAKKYRKEFPANKLEYLTYLLTDRPAALLVRIHISLLKAWLLKKTYSGDTSVQEILTSS